jgi:DNA-directed RNA polymerase specialized sigma24 family protein
MGAADGTVKSWLFRGRQTLHRALGVEDAPRA